MHSIITYGFGPDGSINAIPLYGFYDSSPTDTTPVIDIEVNSKVTRSISFNGYINRSISFNSSIVRQISFRGNL